MTWIDVVSQGELAAKGKLVVRHDGRQILVVQTETGIYAAANRCPHEGYPLSEGTVGEGTGSEGCVLTCNWHNWKFDLASGETLVGGDRLPRYKVRLADGRVWLDISPVDPQIRRREILSGVTKALADEDQQRLVRETARLMQLGADAVDAVRIAIAWAGDRFEYGMTHALGGAPDWLALHDRAETTADEKLAAIGEILGHVADDAPAGRIFPFPAGRAAWSADAFLAAIESEDEATSVRLLRGALAARLTPDDLMPSLLGAALAHYADFGHALIYTVATGDLIRRLGPETEETLLLLLVRELVYARREDLLPEFRDYRKRLAAWGEADGPCPPLDCPPLDPASLRRCSAKSAMAVVAAWGAQHPPEAVLPVLVAAGAWLLLHVDERELQRTDGKIADNVGWLDFTHILTFAQAGRMALRRRRDLWPAIALQLACFIGRNNPYVDETLDTAPFAVADPAAFIAAETRALFDHGSGEFIYSVHLVKTLRAAIALAEAFPPTAPIVLAALYRFLHAPIKSRHLLRTARQMREFVAEE